MGLNSQIPVIKLLFWQLEKICKLFLFPNFQKQQRELLQVLREEICFLLNKSRCLPSTKLAKQLPTGLQMGQILLLKYLFYHSQNQKRVTPIALKMKQLSILNNSCSQRFAVTYRVGVHNNILRVTSPLMAIMI